MILFTWGQVTRHEPSFPTIEANRWSFQVQADRKCVTVGVHRQIKFRDTGWHDCASSYYMVVLGWAWSWGRGHMYYDGPHDSVDIGFLHFNWSGEWCDRCYQGI